MINLDLFDPNSLESMRRFNKSAHPVNLSPIRSRLFSRLQKAARNKLMDLDVIVQGPLDLILLSDLSNIVKEVESTNLTSKDSAQSLRVLIGHIENKCVAFSLIKETLAITEAKYVANVMTEENIRDTQFYQSLINFTRVSDTLHDSEEENVNDWDKMSNMRKRELCRDFEESDTYAALVKDGAKGGQFKLAFRNFLNDQDIEFPNSLGWNKDWRSEIPAHEIDRSGGNFSNAKQIWETVTYGLDRISLDSAAAQNSALSFMANLQALRFKPQQEADPASVAELWTMLVQWSNKGKGLPLEAVQRKKFIKNLFQLHASICSDFHKCENAGNEAGQIATIILMYWFLYYLELKKDDNVLPRIVRMVASTAWATSLKAWAAKIASWYLHFSKIPMSILYEESALINSEIENFMAKSYLTDQQVTFLAEHKAKLAEDADNVLIPSIREVLRTEFNNYKTSVHADFLLPDAMISYYWPHKVASLPSEDDSLEHLFHHHSASSPVSTILPTTRPKVYDALCDVVMDAQNAMVMYKNLMDYLLLNYDGFPIVANSIEIPDDGKTFQAIDRPIYWDFQKHNPYTAITKKYVVNLGHVEYPSRYPFKTPYDGKYFKPMWQSNYKRPIEFDQTKENPLYYLRSLEVPRVYAQFQEFYSIPVPFAMVSTSTKEATKVTFERLSEMMMNINYGWDDDDKFLVAAKTLCSSNTVKARALADLLAGDMFCYVARVDGNDCVDAGVTAPDDSIGALAGIFKSTPGPKVSSMFKVVSEKENIMVKYWDFLALMDTATTDTEALNKLKWRVILPTAPAIYGHPTKEMLSVNKPGSIPLNVLKERMRVYKVANYEGQEFYVAFVIHTVIPIMSSSEKGIWETVDLGISVDVLDTSFVRPTMPLSAYSDAFTSDLKTCLIGGELATDDSQVWIDVAQNEDGTAALTYTTVKPGSIKYTREDKWIQGYVDILNKPLSSETIWTYYDYFYNTSTVVLPHVRFRPQELSESIKELWDLQYCKTMFREGEYDLIETAEVNANQLIMLDRSDYQEAWRSEDSPLLSGTVETSNRYLKINNYRPNTPTSPGHDEYVDPNALTPSGDTDTNPKSRLLDGATAHPAVTDDKVRAADGSELSVQPDVNVTINVPEDKHVSPTTANVVQNKTVAVSTQSAENLPTVGDPQDAPAAASSSPVSATIPVEEVDKQSKERAEEANTLRKPNKKRKKGSRKDDDDSYDEPKDI